MNPYEIAKTGGRNKGLLRRFQNERESSIRKSIRSMKENISLHEDKIRNPLSYVDPEQPNVKIDDLVNRYWPDEIEDYKQQIEVLEGILRERKP